jgi:hypothetical protein
LGENLTAYNKIQTGKYIHIYYSFLLREIIFVIVPFSYFLYCYDKTPYLYIKKQFIITKCVGIDFFPAAVVVEEEKIRLRMIYG